MTQVISTGTKGKKNKVPTAQVIIIREVDGKKQSITQHLRKTSKDFTNHRGIPFKVL
jgi:hypothetical protein